MYLTLVQLAEMPGATELAQVASDEHGAMVDPALMNLTLRDGDRSEYDADEIAGADRAKARIQTAVDETNALIDAHLARRVKVPRDAVPVVLVQIARAIVRYELHKHLIAAEGTHPVVRDYKEKMRLLESIRDGKVTLGAEDPEGANRTRRDDIRIKSDTKVFGRDQMRNFR